MTTRSTCSACMASADLPAPCSQACLRSARSLPVRNCLAEFPACLRAIRNRCSRSSIGIVVTLVWSGGLTFIILKVIGALVPLRVRHEDEVIGLDVSLHGEAIQ